MDKPRNMKMPPEDSRGAWVPYPSLKYLDEFVRLKCAGDMLPKRLFPDAKEITESFAAYDAAMHYGLAPLDQPNVLVVSVADGHRPRTGATFAYRSAWSVVSVDPQLFCGPWGIDRLTCLREKAEHVDFTRMPLLDPSVVGIVAVHSHAPLQPVWENLLAAHPRAEWFVVAIPCCKAQELPVPLWREYEDWGIHSPKRVVRIWKGDGQAGPS